MILDLDPGWLFACLLCFASGLIFGLLLRPRRQPLLTINRRIAPPIPGAEHRWGMAVGRAELVDELSAEQPESFIIESMREMGWVRASERHATELSHN